MRKEIRIAGFGGQGIVLAGRILGEAAINAGFKAVQTQSYGPESRGGAVSLSVPHAYAVKKQLDRRGIKVDFRKGLDGEPDVIRIGPHFYTEDGEIKNLFEAIDAVLEKGEFKKHPQEVDGVT